jgi:hypothetical protein
MTNACRRRIVATLLALVCVVVVSNRAFAQVYAIRKSGMEPARERALLPPDDTVSRNRALLDSLGRYRGTWLVREYVLSDGTVGREYASRLPIDDAPTAVTVFYRTKLVARGWQMLQEHAAVSVYANGNRMVSIVRAGPSDPGPPPGARSLRSAKPSRKATFFFAIEAGPRA